MSKSNSRVCPLERAGSLESGIRKFLQNPRKILKPYTREGSTILDYGCGPGFFTVEMARMVGRSGRIIALDLQQGMLQKLGDKIRGSELEGRIVLRRVSENKIAVSELVDFVLLFYVVHELPDKKRFFQEIEAILKPNAKALIVEPRFHVSKSMFEDTLSKAQESDLRVSKGPRIFLSHTALLEKHLGHF